MSEIKLSFTFKEGSSAQEIATKLRWHAGLLEGMPKKEAASVKNTSAKAKAAEVEDEELEDDEDEDFAPAAKKKAAKKKVASFDEEDEDEAEVEDDEETEEDDEDFTEPAPKAKKKAPAKTARKKKITVDQVNDACKARAQATGGKAGRNEVLAILKKKFKTTSVSELKADQFEACIKAMAV